MWLNVDERFLKKKKILYSILIVPFIALCKNLNKSVFIGLFIANPFILRCWKILLVSVYCKFIKIKQDSKEDKVIKVDIQIQCRLRLLKNRHTTEELYYH